MEEGTARSEPGLQHSVYARSYAAAEPGLVAQNNPVNNVDGGYNCVYGSLATPGYYTYANPWATGHAVNHTFAPFVDSNPSHLTESTFAAGAAYDDGIGLPAAPDPYILGPSAARGPVGEYIGAGYQYPDPSLSTANSLAAGAIGNGYQDHFPASSHAADGNGNRYQGSFAAANSHAADGNGNGYQSPFPENGFAAGINDNSYLGFFPANSSAAYTNGNNCQGPFPTSSHAADGNGNCYQNSFPANGFTTQENATVNFPTGVARCRPRSQSFRHGSKGFHHATPVPSAKYRLFSRTTDLSRHAKLHQANSKVYRCRCQSAGCRYSSYRRRTRWMSISSAVSFLTRAQP